MAASDEAVRELAAQVAQILGTLGKMDEKIDNLVKNSEERLATVEGKVFEVEQKQDSLKKEIENLQRNQNLGQEMLVGLETEVKLNTNKGVDNEQYQRNFNVRIFNLPETKDETIEECEAKVLELFRTKLDVDVKIEDIDILHRLGPKRVKNDIDKGSDATNKEHMSVEDDNNDKQDDLNNENGAVAPDKENELANQNKDGDRQLELEENSESSRPIIVSFISRRIRRRVLANRSKLKKRPGQKAKPIIITEDLTKYHHTLLCKARDSEKFDGGVWSKDGKILAKHNGRIQRIRGFSDLTFPTSTDDDPLVYTPRRGRGNGRYQRGKRGGHQRGGYHRFHSTPAGRFQGQGHPLRQNFGMRGYPQSQRGSPFYDKGLIALSNRYDGLLQA